MKVKEAVDRLEPEKWARTVVIKGVSNGTVQGERFLTI